MAFALVAGIVAFRKFSQHRGSWVTDAVRVAATQLSQGIPRIWKKNLSNPFLIFFSIWLTYTLFMSLAFEGNLRAHLIKVVTFGSLVLMP